MNILDLPDSALEQVLEYLSYDEIARNRLVCKRFDKVCKVLLNRGFSKMIKRHSVNLKRIKSLLPRRESERRDHPMAQHANILSCIETRIAMLSLTYTKYMELNLCCFIPGKVIDEVNRILRLIETTNKPLRAHEVLQELRDISSMAIEHFDEKIARALKKCFMELTSQKYNSPSNSTVSKVNCEANKNNPQLILGVLCVEDHFKPREPVLVATPQNTMHRTCGTTYKCVENSNKLQKLAQKYKLAIKKFNRMIHIQNKQAKQLRENSVTMSEMNTQIIELKGRLELIKQTEDNTEITTTDKTDAESPCDSDLNPNIAVEKSSVTTESVKPQKATTAAIILKRRIEESIDKAELETLGLTAKMMKVE